MKHYNSNSLANWDTEIEGEVHGYMDNETVAFLLQEAHFDEFVQTTNAKQRYETRKAEKISLTEYTTYYDFGTVSKATCQSAEYIVGESVQSILKYGGAQTNTDCLMVGKVSHTITHDAIQSKQTSTSAHPIEYIVMTTYSKNRYSRT